MSSVQNCWSLSLPASVLSLYRKSLASRWVQVVAQRAFSQNLCWGGCSQAFYGRRVLWPWKIGKGQSKDSNAGFFATGLLRSFHSRVGNFSFTVYLDVPLESEGKRKMVVWGRVCLRRGEGVGEEKGWFSCAGSVSAIIRISPQLYEAVLLLWGVVTEISVWKDEFHMIHTPPMK